VPELARPTRRRFLGLAGALLGAGALSSAAGYVIDRAMSVDPGGAGSLADVDHFVLLMQENRSFDHYFGTLSGVRGFDDMPSRLAQPGYRPGVGPDPSGRLMPFHLSVRQDPGADPEIPVDPAHSWAAQHGAWNGGAMDAWVTTHLASDGDALGPQVMGYYARAELPAHYLLADAFTVCDNYFSSVLGPTAPNRLYCMTGTLDPDGVAGGPVLADASALTGTPLTWRTYPENLTDAGVSWKIYNSLRPDQSSELTGMMKYFRSFRQPHLAERGLAPRYPSDFATDVANGTLPAVSWLIPSMARSEHPSFPSARGAEQIVQVLDVLTDNPAVWERCALIVSYDENGGFFDHVPPPTAPVGTPGEYVTAGVPAQGPIGLGFRVPCLVISPYTRGGNVYSGRLDHTSQLRLLERRFGVEVPNLSSWRRSAVGDLTAVFTGHRHVPMSSVEPTVGRSTHDAAREMRQLRDVPPPAHGPYPIPPNNRPRQEASPVRHRIG